MASSYIARVLYIQKDLAVSSILLMFHVDIERCKFYINALNKHVTADVENDKFGYEY